MKTIFTLLLFIASTACNRISYLGQHHEPTSKIDVYVEQSSIHKQFDVVGKGYLTSRLPIKPEKLQEMAVAEARKKGADAVLFQDYLVRNEFGAITTVSRTDSLEKAVVNTSTTSIDPVVHTGRNILFLKYRD